MSKKNGRYEMTGTFSVKTPAPTQYHSEIHEMIKRQEKRLGKKATSASIVVTVQFEDESEVEIVLKWKP